MLRLLPSSLSLGSVVRSRVSVWAIGSAMVGAVACSGNEPHPDATGTSPINATSDIPSNTSAAGSVTTPAGQATATAANPGGSGSSATGVTPTSSLAASVGPSAIGSGAPASSASGPDGQASATPSVVSGDPPVGSIPGAGMSAGACTLGSGQQTGEGQTLERYLGADITRDGKNYKMITNGWGQGWDSHDISWLGTTLSVNTFQGDRQSNGAPAGYPSVFCGRYSDRSQECGLPMPLSSVTALNTAVSWSHATADGVYNVAYDVWLGNGSAAMRGLQSYFMVWLKDPVGEGPAGSLVEEAVTIPNAPGVWNIVAGEVNNLPIVNYVRAEGDELPAMAFNIMDFINDAKTRNLEFPGDDVLAVAIGFEIWTGPVTGLKLNDFCLDIQ